jgi:hypothetical protein
MGVESKTHTVQDVDTYVFRQFGDDSSVQITSVDIMRFINLGQRQIFETNPSLNMANASTDIVANQNAYNLSTDPNFTGIRLIRSVRYQGSVLNPVTRQQAETYILYNNTLYPSPTNGVPTDWWLDDSGVLYLYPTPAQGSTAALSIHYMAYPKTVLATTDMLDIPDSHYPALLSFVLAQVYELDENWQANAAKKAEYKELLSIVKDRTEVEEDHFPSILLDPEDSVY